jgi:preprotein translocase SecE subunit
MRRRGDFRQRGANTVMFWLWVKIVVLLAVVLSGAVYLIKRRGQLRQFLGEVQVEMSKVTWPPMDEVINSTILIGIVTIALSLLCLVVDSLFAGILRVFYR